MFRGAFLMGLVAAAALMAATPALAAPKPKPTSAGMTIALNGSATPSIGQSVTFTYSAPNIQSPRIELDCYDTVTKALVYGEAGPASQSFLLGGSMSIWYQHPSWTVSCTATLYYWDFHPSQTFVPLATTTFTALGK